jgi:orotidine-5'-phosphate decarboxylase
MTRQELAHLIRTKKSYLCVGLDTDLNKLPVHLRSASDPVFEFNRQIIDATYKYAVAYKPNLAFYEALGARGWESLERTLAYLPRDVFTIADAKRGDIGNTSALYAKAFFETMNFDAVTVAPYMGEDSVRPFLGFKNKWVILLAHTSNPGNADFQLTESKVTGRKLYEEVVMKAQQWASANELMFVVGATRADKVGEIRKLAPDHFFLIPGVGAQGGDLAEVSRHGRNADIGLLVSASRSILYASGEKDFATLAGAEAARLAFEMQPFL